METEYSGLIAWLLGLAIVVTVVWLLVYYASRSAARAVVTEISNIEASLVGDGRTLRLRNTGAVAVASIVVERFPPHATATGTLATAAALAAGAVLDIEVQPDPGDLPDKTLLRWRVGSPAGPIFSTVRPLTREA